MTTEAVTAPAKLNTQEAAEYLGLAPPTLSTWRCTGGGPVYFKAGRKVLYLVSDLDAWLAARRMSRSTAHA